MYTDDTFMGGEVGGLTCVYCRHLYGGGEVGGLTCVY